MGKMKMIEGMFAWNIQFLCKNGHGSSHNNQGDF